MKKTFSSDSEKGGSKSPTFLLVLLMINAFIFTGMGFASLPEERRNELPATITMEGKTLTLNGVGFRKILWYTVLEGGLYLEHPSRDPQDIIESKQIKCFRERFIIKKIPCVWVQHVIIKLFEKTNPPELVKKYEKEIKQFASWYEKDALMDDVTVTTYVPGKGLSLEYMGVTKGTIPGEEFARMYFTCGFGDKADETTKRSFSGLDKKPNIS